MTDTVSTELSFDEFDEQLNPGPEVTEFDRIVDRVVCVSEATLEFAVETEGLDRERCVVIPNASCR